MFFESVFTILIEDVSIAVLPSPIHLQEVVYLSIIIGVLKRNLSWMDGRREGWREGGRKGGGREVTHDADTLRNFP